MKRMITLTGLAGICVTAAFGQNLTTMHEDQIDGFNGSVTFSFFRQTMIPRDKTLQPAKEAWQHYHQTDRDHAIEAYMSPDAKKAGSVPALGCIVGPNDSIHIFLTRQNMAGAWVPVSTSTVMGAEGDVVIYQDDESDIGSFVPAHRQMAQRYDPSIPLDHKVPGGAKVAEVKKGLGGYGTEHVKHIDWVWRSVIKDPNYEWSQPQYVGSGITERVNMGLRRVGGNDKDVHMAAIAVRDGAANKCSFTLGPCGYFRIHKNGEGTGPQVSKIVRNLPVSCLATKRPDTGVEKKIGTLPDLKAK